MSVNFPPPVYKDPRTYPVPPNNLTGYNPNTNDLTVLENAEKLALFKTSAPGGNTQINAVYAPRVSGNQLYISGNSYLQGPISTPVFFNKTIYLPDGQSNNPSLAFQTDKQTGIYGPTGGQVSFTSGGVSQVSIGGGALQTNVPITTPPGQNLILNPSGPSVDFTNHTLINVAGISQNPNYYVLIGQIVTTNNTPTVLLLSPTVNNAGYTFTCNITCTNGNNGTDIGSFIMDGRGKNISGVVSVVTPYTRTLINLDATLVGISTKYGTSGSDIEVVVTGLPATTINWICSLIVTRRLF